MVAATDKKREVSINVRTFPADLRKKFKRFCLDRNISMSRAIEMLVGSAVSGDLTERQDKSLTG